ncbi:NAD(P)-binding protein [Punctularia strigosozonata HHB-11173 SS5]|uniref:NAD(P)-binding protein n=1 Tax=Punctularia strigosozonata (strain HHB-11173) TaxID=741275 RepID=UPI0004418553|nr:NAD(P)-binding protein [Punctularia strigosozonata HHB-11173 SS5]EIN08924.1 NAD(P)-binding protein [Punctularia strigosozonata HHB-11173 SS5]
MPTETKKLILVTGISGFVGGHIVHQLVQHGYRVRGTVRTPKFESYRKNLAFYGDDVEVIAVDDLVRYDWTDALKGVDGVIHNAAPLPGAMAPEAALEFTVSSTTNILHAAEKAGIKKFVITSSIITVVNPFGYEGDYKLNANTDWNPITKEQTLDPQTVPLLVYQGYKKLAEQAIWDFEEKHPHVNITAILPGYIYGPFAPEVKVGPTELGTNKVLYDSLKPDGLFGYEMYVDVRDTARALVLGLEAPASIKRKRVLVLAEPELDWKQVVPYLIEQRPELKDRLPDPAKANPTAPFRVTDNNLQDYLHFGEYLPWQKTILDTVDNLLALEKEWAAAKQ